jgi:hypothetical protein
LGALHVSFHGTVNVCEFPKHETFEGVVASELWWTKGDYVQFRENLAWRRSLGFSEEDDVDEREDML